MGVLKKLTGLVGYGGRTETLTRNWVFLQEYSRTPSKGKHFFTDRIEV